VRYVSAYIAANDWSAARGVLVASSWFVAAVSIAVVTVIAFIFNPLAGLLALPTPVLVLTVALLPVQIALLVVSAALRGLNRVVLGQIAEKAVLPSSFVLLVLGFIFISDSGSLTPFLAVTFRLVGASVGVLVSFSMLRQVLPSTIRAARSRFTLARWLRSSATFLLIGSIAVLMKQTDILMLAALRGPVDAGVYQVATRGADLVGLVPLAISTVILPQISRYGAQNRQRDLQRLVTLSAWAGTATALAMAAVLVVFRDGLLLLLFGEEFALAGSALAILALASAAGSALGPGRELLAMTGHESKAATGLVAGAFANIALNALLIPQWGPTGAAIATGASLILWRAILAVFAWKHLGIKTPVSAGTLGSTTTSPPS
jgi:O-antigen/teichoic acid export membrane protein